MGNWSLFHFIPLCTAPEVHLSFPPYTLPQAIIPGEGCQFIQGLLDLNLSEMEISSLGAQIPTTTGNFTPDSGNTVIPHAASNQYVHQGTSQGGLCCIHYVTCYFNVDFPVAKMLTITRSAQPYCTVHIGSVCVSNPCTNGAIVGVSKALSS